jgi:hypothetical protein
MKRIALVHYQPLELYPPVMNFINDREGHPGSNRLDIYTTYCYAGIKDYQPSSAGIHIYRLGAKRKKESVAGRAWHYFRFYFLTCWLLIRTRPSVVFYFETFSSFPAWLYKRFINPRTKLFIHYHEYMSPLEYERGMRLIKWFHRLEKKIYKKAVWISHTNAARMQRFNDDMKGVELPQQFILPNYPPSTWRHKAQNKADGVLKTVYIGAFSLDTMFVREFADWVIKQGGAVTWDIYSLNRTEEANAFIHTLPGDWIRIHPGIEYNDLPELLTDYDIGLILYTGHIPNWVDNAPNKLFEYLSVGLDIWLPVQMAGSLAYLTTTTYPKVMAVDFQKLGSFDWKAARDKGGLEYSPSPYYCEKVYGPLWELLLKHG